MAYLIFTKITEEAMKAIGRKFIKFPDDEFFCKSRRMQNLANEYLSKSRFFGENC